MRKFYEVMPNSQLAKVMWVEDYDLKSLNYGCLINSTACAPEALNNVILNVREKGLKKPDYLGNPLSWPIVSQKLLNFVIDEIKDDCQILSAPLYSKENGSRVDGYFLLNILRLIPCLNESESVVLRNETNDIEFVTEISVDAALVLPHINIFRVKEAPGSVIVSEAFLGKIQSRDLTGIVMRAAST